MNTLLNGMKNATNYGFTENGGLTHKTTTSALLDLFALGGSYREKSDDDCIFLFRKAYAENPIYALKCLFYLGDCRGGQGERRFFRVCAKWLANNHPEAMKRNLIFIPEYRRWDDLYTFIDTPLENDAFALIKHQLALDVQSKTPSLLAKWLKSENTSSIESRKLAGRTREYLGMNHKQYRKTLSILRARINVLETLMSAGRWDEIEFDKIPSRAGLIYRNAFAVNDFTKERYAKFMSQKEVKVNAGVLNPVDIAEKVIQTYRINPTERNALNAYWNNLTDYYNGREENGLCVVDVSGSMGGQPMYAAVGMGAYIAERGHGPFANHFITFSGNPQIVEIKGQDIVDKLSNIEKADWGYNTDIQKVLDLILNTAINTKCSAADMPTRLYVFSDMQFDKGLQCSNEGHLMTIFEANAQKWKQYGYDLPQVIFWNLRASENNIPALGDKFSYISGFSMNMISEILGGKTGYDLMMAKLDSERYARVK